MRAHVEAALAELRAAVAERSRWDLSDFTDGEQGEAWNLLRLTTQLDAIEHDLLAARLVFLAQHAPGLSTGEALQALSDAEFAQFAALTSEAL